MNRGYPSTRRTAFGSSDPVGGYTSKKNQQEVILMTQSLNPTVVDSIPESAGSGFVSEAIVRAEPKPEFTETWHPFSHGEILDALSVAVEEKGLVVIDKKYSIRIIFVSWL